MGGRVKTHTELCESERERGQLKLNLVLATAVRLTGSVRGARSRSADSSENRGSTPLITDISFCGCEACVCVPVCAGTCAA